MNGWTPRPFADSTNPFIISAGMSAVPMENFPIYRGGALDGLVIGIFCSGIAGTVSAQLQHAFAKTGWENVTGKSVTLSNGWNYIKLNGRLAGDIALMPLFDRGRIVITSDGSGAGTISYAAYLQEL